MLKKISSLLFASLIILSTNINATGWTGETTVTEIYALSETQVIIKLSSFNNPNNCSVNEAGHAIINPSTNKAWFSMILAAYASKQKVNFFVSDICIPIWPSTSFAETIHVRLI